jgi:hypothetical protein
LTPSLSTGLELRDLVTRHNLVLAQANRRKNSESATDAFIRDAVRVKLFLDVALDPDLLEPRHVVPSGTEGDPIQDMCEGLVIAGEGRGGGIGESPHC